nr:EOG090X0302 [Ceriodaphnia reticulata]
MFLITRLRKSFLLRICLTLAVVSLLWLHVGIFIYRGAEIDFEHRFRNSSVLLNHPNFNQSNIELAKPTNLSVLDLKEKIINENNEQKIWNSKQISWPPVNETEFWPKGIVITIQVHNRISYMRKLLQSLSQAALIDRALLVFSHNIYSEELNEIIQSIPFAAVMQIHFPYSTQLFPSSFPGDSPSDCPRDINKERAIAIGCSNAETPDLYGHYREARYSQTKHHWWWKTNFIFGEIRALRDYNGPVVFMEEDHYVAEDFLHVLWLQQQLLYGGSDCKFCSQARILSLGTYPKYFNHREASNMVDLLPWSSSKHNMGMAFNRSIWKDFQHCADMFCSVDDYNWDWSLLHVAQQCLPSLYGDPPNEKGKTKFILGACYEQLSSIYGDQEEYKLYWAQSLYQAGLYANSLKVCGQIAEPKLKGKVLKLEAAIRFAEDDLAAAQNSVNACFALSAPNDVDTLVNMGCIRFKEEDYSRALNKFQSAVHVSGFEPQLLYNVAVCHYKMKEYAPAIKSIADIIERGIRDHPELSVGMATEGLEVRSVVLMNQAKIYWDRENYVQVEKLFRQSAELCGDADVWRLNVAHTLFMQESKFREATSFYEPLVKQNYDNILDVSAVVLANLCVCYLVTSQNEEAEELLRKLEKEEEQKSLENPQSKFFHLSIVNLVIGTLYCSKGNYEFGISRLIKSLEPFHQKLGTDTWFYAKRCLMSLLENMAKQIVVIKDSILDDILQFLDSCQFYGREVQTILENPTSVNAQVNSARFTVTYEARIIKSLLLQIMRN